MPHDAEEELQEVIQYTAPMVTEENTLAAPAEPCPPVAPQVDHGHNEDDHVEQLRQQVREVRDVVRQMATALGLERELQVDITEQELQQQLIAMGTLIRQLKGILEPTQPPTRNQPPAASSTPAHGVRDQRPPQPPAAAAANVLAVPSARPAIIPSKDHPSTLTFRQIHDQGGLMHLIGTLGGKEEWRNPVLREVVCVEASSIKSGRPAEVADRWFENQRFFTANEEYSWISIDFGPYRIRPNHYCFAHRGGRDVGYYVRNWELHGSMDGVHWEGILRHNNDQTINSQNFIGHWPIPNQQKFFRAFRISLDPKGNSLGTGALVVSCFEVYGDWYYEE